jgi:ACS family tartrate transporter-like MFS transporter
VTAPASAEAKLFSRCAWRLIPFMGALYVANFLDRVNVGFAALSMNRDIGLSAQAYGLGAGMFFVSYFFCEVPSNLIMEKVGARLWMFRIMLTWGLVSMATAFARGPVSFYVLRFLLGVCEAGFFPGMILYLTYWFPAATRGQFSALFLSAILVANIIGAPISGFILTVAGGVAGLKSWQWLFLLEGIPSLILGVVTLFYLPDRPATARWLTADEKKLIHDVLARDELSPQTARDGLSDYRIWLLCLADIGLIMATYGLALWLPQIVKSMGFDNLQTGFLVAIPYAFAIVAMILWARASDARGERLWHVALPALLASASLIVAAVTGNGVWTMLALTMATLGIYGAVAVMWTLPQSLLGGTAAAAAIALVNSVGNLGGFAGPAIAGYLKDTTGTYSAAMLVFAAGLAMAAAITIAMSRFNLAAKPAIVSS